METLTLSPKNPQSAEIGVSPCRFNPRHVKAAPFLTYLAVLPFADSATPARQIVEMSFYRGIGTQYCAVWITAPGHYAYSGTAEGRASSLVNSAVMVDALRNAGVELKIPVLSGDSLAGREAVAAVAAALGFPNAVLVSFCPRTVK